MVTYRTKQRRKKLKEGKVEVDPCIRFRMYKISKSYLITDGAEKCLDETMILTLKSKFSVRMQA